MDWLKLRNDIAQNAFTDAKKKAKELKLEESWDHCLDTLKAISNNVNGSVDMWTDFAPFSFNWAIINSKGDCTLNGGLIFHGPHDNGGDGGAPTFSVSLEPQHGWQLHT